MTRTQSLAALMGAAAVVVPTWAAAQSRSLIPAETLEVMIQRQDTMFTRMDLNRDNAITSTEIQTAMAQLRGQGRPGGGQGGGQGGGMGAGMAGLGMLFMFAGPPPGAAPGAAAAGPAGSPEGAPGGPRRMQMDPAQLADRIIQALDKDGDSQIGRAEMRAATEERFKAMDRNGDGVLSDDERPQMRFRGGQGAGPGGGMAPPVEIPSGDGGF